MEHKHLDTIFSTQDYIIENYASQKTNFLVSCETQSNGNGQHGKKWDSFTGTLCCSFTLRPNKVITITSLEVAVLIQKFIFKKFKKITQVKWPNDIYFEGSKVSGILIKIKSGTCLTGVGINIHKSDTITDYSHSGLLQNNIFFCKRSLSEQLYLFILENRLSAQEVISNWEASSIHMNKLVTIKDAHSETTGIFVGVGKDGEALISVKNEIKKIYSGSLHLSI